MHQYVNSFLQIVIKLYIEFKMPLNCFTDCDFLLEAFNQTFRCTDNDLSEWQYFVGVSISLNANPGKTRFIADLETIFRQMTIIDKILNNKNRPLLFDKVCKFVGWQNVLIRSYEFECLNFIARNLKALISVSCVPGG